MSKLRDFTERDYYGWQGASPLPSGKEPQIYEIQDNSDPNNFRVVIVSSTDLGISVQATDIEDDAYKFFGYEEEEKALRLGERIANSITLNDSIEDIAERFGLTMS